MAGEDYTDKGRNAATTLTPLDRIRCRLSHRRVAFMWGYDKSIYDALLEWDIPFLKAMNKYEEDRANGRP